MKIQTSTLLREIAAEIHDQAYRSLNPTTVRECAGILLRHAEAIDAGHWHLLPESAIGASNSRPAQSDTQKPPNRARITAVEVEFDDPEALVDSITTAFELAFGDREQNGG